MRKVLVGNASERSALEVGKAKVKEAVRIADGEALNSVGDPGDLFTFGHFPSFGVAPRSQQCRFHVFFSLRLLVMVSSLPLPSLPSPPTSWPHHGRLVAYSCSWHS